MTMVEEKLRTVTIACPVAPPNDVLYRPTRVDMPLTPAESATLRRLMDGLNASNARLPTGRHVESTPSAISWLLAEVARGLELQEDASQEDAQDVPRARRGAHK